MTELEPLQPADMRRGEVSAYEKVGEGSAGSNQGAQGWDNRQSPLTASGERQILILPVLRPFRRQQKTKAQILPDLGLISFISIHRLRRFSQIN